MRAKQVVQSQEKGFGVAGGQNTQQPQGKQGKEDKLGRGQVEQRIEKQQGTNPKNSDQAKIDHRDGKYKITRLAIIGIAAARTTGQHSKPIGNAFDPAGR